MKYVEIENKQVDSALLVGTVLLFFALALIIKRYFDTFSNLFFLMVIFISMFLGAMVFVTVSNPKIEYERLPIKEEK